MAGATSSGVGDADAGVVAGRATRASARLGLTLREVLLAPRAGFESAFKMAEGRARAGRRPAEGFVPYSLSALGGAALFLLWLRLASLLGLRDTPCDFRWSYLVGAAVLGALLSLAGQALWGLIGARTAASLHAEASGRDLRIAWGVALFVQVVALVFLLPLDLLIVGPETFTTERLGDSVSTAWAALSIAVGVSLAAWSLWLFVRGNQAATGLGLGRAIAATVVAIVALVAVLGIFVVIASTTGGQCPTPST
jgi:hypothetical protein